MAAGSRTSLAPSDGGGGPRPGRSFPCGVWVSGFGNAIHHRVHFKGSLADPPSMSLPAVYFPSISVSRNTSPTRITKFSARFQFSATPVCSPPGNLCSICPCVPLVLTLGFAPKPSMSTKVSPKKWPLVGFLVFLFETAIHVNSNERPFCILWILPDFVKICRTLQNFVEFISFPLLFFSRNPNASTVCWGSASLPFASFSAQHESWCSKPATQGALGAAKSLNES